MPSTVYRNIKKRGAGIGTGGVYRGRRTQRGHGVGAILGKILKGGKTILTPMLKKAGKAATNIGKKQAADLVKQGAQKAAEYAVKNKGNIAKSVAGTVGATVIGAVGDRIANNKKQETKKVKAAVKQAKKADNQIKQGLKRKAQAIEKIEEATTKPPAKRRRKKKRGRGLDSIF